MQMTIEELGQIAVLANLDLSKGDQQLFSSQLNSVLEHIEILDELDTSQIEPTCHILPQQNIFRPDTVTPSIDARRAFANAPDKADGYFMVPPVIE